MSDFQDLGLYRNPNAVKEGTQSTDRYRYEIIFDIVTDSVHPKDEILRDLNEHMEFFNPDRANIVTTRLTKII